MTKVTIAGEERETHPAQVVFHQSASANVWRGELLNPDRAIDMQDHGRPIRSTPRYTIMEVTAENTGRTRYSVQMQGNAAAGRRYRTFDSLDAAQAHGIKWAARRFRVVV